MGHSNTSIEPNIYKHLGISNMKESQNEQMGGVEGGELRRKKYGE